MLWISSKSVLDRVEGTLFASAPGVFIQHYTVLLYKRSWHGDKTSPTLETSKAWAIRPSGLSHDVHQMLSWVIGTGNESLYNISDLQRMEVSMLNLKISPCRCRVKFGNNIHGNAIPDHKGGGFLGGGGGGVVVYMAWYSIWFCSKEKSVMCHE